MNKSHTQTLACTYTCSRETQDIALTLKSLRALIFPLAKFEFKVDHSYQNISKEASVGED